MSIVTVKWSLIGVVIVLAVFAGLIGIGIEEDFWSTIGISKYIVLTYGTTFVFHILVT